MFPDFNPQPVLELYQKYAEEQVRNLHDAHELARQNLKQAQIRQKRQYDKKCHGAPDYKVGDCVW